MIGDVYHKELNLSVMVNNNRK